MKKIFSCMLGFSLMLSAINVKSQIPINNGMFSQNAWWFDMNTPSNQNSLWPQVSAAGSRFIRIGGIEPNFEPLYDVVGTNVTSIARLITLVDDLRIAGMEPIVTVGFNPVCTGLPPLGGLSRNQQANIAGQVVQMVNSYYSTRPILYWIIGNEPDLGVNCAPAGGFGWNGGTPGVGAQINEHADSISRYVKSFSSAMKAQDNRIKIIAPELASFGSDNSVWNPVNMIMDQLVSNGIYSIMGTISGGPANGKYFVDYISFHTYPFFSNPGNAPLSRQQIIQEPEATDGFAEKLFATATGRRGIVNMISSTSRNVSNVKIACTEFNLGNHETGLDESTPAGYTDVVNGIGNRSFIAGQWWADVFSHAMNSNSGNVGWVEFMNPWSVQEGNPPGCTEGFGFMSACTSAVGRKRSTYYHYQLIAKNFAGKFYMGQNINGSDADSLKAFASRNCNQIAVMVLNQNRDGNPTSYSFRFDNTTPPAPANGVSFHLNIGTVGNVYTFPIGTDETHLLLFDPCGKYKGMYVYNINDNLTDVAPTWYPSGNTRYCACIENPPPPPPTGMALFESEAFPNPFNEKITINYTLPETAFSGKITITEIASGKEVYKGDLSPFENSITLDHLKLDNGIYLCHLLGDDGSYSQIKLVKIK